MKKLIKSIIVSTFIVIFAVISMAADIGYYAGTVVGFETGKGITIRDDSGNYLTFNITESSLLYVDIKEGMEVWLEARGKTLTFISRRPVAKPMPIQPILEKIEDIRQKAINTLSIKDSSMISESAIILEAWRISLLECGHDPDNKLSRECRNYFYYLYLSRVKTNDIQEAEESYYSGKVIRFEKGNSIDLKDEQGNSLTFKINKSLHTNDKLLFTAEDIKEGMDVWLVVRGKTVTYVSRPLMMISPIQQIEKKIEDIRQKAISNLISKGKTVPSEREIMYEASNIARENDGDVLGYQLRRFFRAKYIDLRTK